MPRATSLALAERRTKDPFGDSLAAPMGLAFLAHALDRLGLSASRWLRSHDARPVANWAQIFLNQSRSAAWRSSRRSI
jgi:hypothetical protein